MSGTRRFWFRNVSADSTQFGVMSDLIRSWIGLESVSGRPTYARYITDLRPTNHLPSVAELRPTRPRTLPDKTDTTPTYNRQTTDNLSGRDLSNMFERSLPDKFVCPNINRHQTDKTESIPTVNRYLPEFEDFVSLRLVSCRFGWCDWGITVNDNFIIFLQNYIAPIPAWFIRHERWNSPPEFSIVTGAVFLKVSCERLFPQCDNFIAHTAIFIPVLLAVFLVFITDHVSLINSLSKFGVHIGDRLSFYQFSFNQGVMVYYIWQEFISELDHIFYVIEHLAHMEWCTGDVIFVICFHEIFVWSIEDMLWLLTWGKFPGRRSHKFMKVTHFANTIQYTKVFCTIRYKYDI